MTPSTSWMVRVVSLSVTAIFWRCAMTAFAASLLLA